MFIKTGALEHNLACGFSSIEDKEIYLSACYSQAAGLNHQAEMIFKTILEGRIYDCVRIVFLTS